MRIAGAAVLMMLRRVSLMVLVATSAAQAQSRPLVVLRTVTPQRSVALEASLREMLARLNVTLDAFEGDAGSDVLAIADVDLSTGAIVLDSPSRYIVIRRSFPIGATADLSIETAATLIASSVDVLVHTDPPRAPIKIEPPLAPSPTAEAPRPRPLDPVGLDLGVGLGVKLSGGSSAVDFGGSVNALVTRPVGRQLPGVLAAFTYQPELELSSEGVSLRGRVISPRLFVQLELFRWARGRLEAGAGGGVDVYTLTPSQREGELLRPMAQRTFAAPVVSGLVTYRLPVGESVHLFASITVDGDLRPSRQSPGQGMNAEPRPWTVRPALVLGVSFAPWRAVE